jgi:hypothetical protein
VQVLLSLSVTLEIPSAMWDLLKLGVGGYIIGRSVETAVKTWRHQ